MTAPARGKSNQTTIPDNKRHFNKSHSSHDDYSFTRNLQLISWIGWVGLLMIFGVWWWKVDTQRKIEVVLMSLTYSAIEFTWYTCTLQLDDGSVSVVPFRVKGRKGFTSVEQLVGNILYIPIAFQGYASLLSHDNSTAFAAFILIFMRVALFPFNIWLLEIVQDTAFKRLYGFNPAWNYTGAPGSRLNGAINLHHWKLWTIMGSVSVLFNPMTGVIFLLSCIVLIQTIKWYAINTARN